MGVSPDLGSAVVVRGEILTWMGHRQAQVVQAVGDRGGEGIGVTRPFLTLLCEEPVNRAVRRSFRTLELGSDRF